MARRKTYKTLNVYLNGRFVGELDRARNGAVSFKYDADWLAWEHAIPVSLSLPLRDDRYTGPEVINFFDNLLPDVKVIRDRVAARSGAGGSDAYSLLSTIGRDCVGALQFLPRGEEPQPLNDIAGEPVNEARIADILRNLDMAPLGIRDESSMRISVAGAQDKTALLWHNGSWIEPAGTTPTTHIIKPQIGELRIFDMKQSVENEHLCLEMMRSFGFDVADTSIVDFEDQRALVVKRFDRQWSADGRLLRIPQEDLCQALGKSSGEKYQEDGGPTIPDIMEFLKGSNAPRNDRGMFFKACVMFWLMGAPDGHAKNFSIFVMQGGRFRLTPMYDVMTVQNSVDSKKTRYRDFTVAMSFGTNRKYKVHDISRRHIEETAKTSGLTQGVVNEIFEELIDKADEKIASVVAGLPEGFPTELSDALATGMSARIRGL